jgi:transposase
VHRFNADGLGGLSDRPHPGRPPSLSAEQQKELAGWVETGPELEQDGVIRWRRVDLRERVKERFNVTLDVRTVGRLLRKLDFRRMSVRPQHRKTEPAVQAALKKTSATWCARRWPTGCAAGRSRSGSRACPRARPEG